MENKQILNNYMTAAEYAEQIHTTLDVVFTLAKKYSLGVNYNGKLYIRKDAPTFFTKTELKRIHINNKINFLLDRMGNKADRMPRFRRLAKALEMYNENNDLVIFMNTKNELIATDRNIDAIPISEILIDECKEITEENIKEECLFQVQLKRYNGYMAMLPNAKSFVSADTLEELVAKLDRREELHKDGLKVFHKGREIDLRENMKEEEK